jgi:hypothetical protein
MLENSTMYRLPPIIPDHMEFDLPTRMYKLPVIQHFETAAPANMSDDDMQALKELEKRQESILDQLENLKIEVSKLQAPKTAKQTGPRDLVIRASPSHPPNVLPIICQQLMNQMKIFTSTHIHSNVVKGIPNLLKDFLPNSNCSARTESDLCLTLIWKNVGKDLELVTSPTSNSLLKGEVNLLRYFSRRFNLFNIGNLTEKEVHCLENTFDLIHSELWSAGQANTLVENLMGKKEPQFLVGKKIQSCGYFGYDHFQK